MDMLARLLAYFQALDPRCTVDVLPCTTSLEPQPASHPAAMPAQELTRTALLACTPAHFHPAPSLPGLDYVVLTQHSPLPAIQENLDINARGFDPGAPAATVAEAEAFRAGLLTNCAVTARWNELPVAAGMCTPPNYGITEVVGVTTLPAYRRRGIGAALTSEIVRVAFGMGIDIVILRTDNPEAHRMYRRIGFAEAAWLITRSEGQTEQQG